MIVKHIQKKNKIMNLTVRVHRMNQNSNQTSSICWIEGENKFPLFAGLGLERGWRNNENGVSCYPIGKYDLVYEYSDRFKCMLWEVKNVPNRAECKFHAANYWYQLEGCTSLGLEYTDINKDGYKDVTASASTMKRFHKVLEDYKKVKLIVTGELNIF